MPEAIEAAALLLEEGVEAGVLVASSPDRLFREARACLLGRAGRDGATARRSHLERLVAPAHRGWPLVTVIDGAPQPLAALGGCLGMLTTPLGVDAFGQSGGLAELYDFFWLNAEQIALAALAALDAGGSIPAEAASAR